MSHRSPCGKCDGKGRIAAFAHVAGGTCFACGGEGYFEVKTDPALLAKRRAASKAKRDAAMAVRVAAGNAAADARAELYASDPRIGPETRARCAQHPTYAFETYRVMARIDAGDEERHFDAAQALRNVAR